MPALFSTNNDTDRLRNFGQFLLDDSDARFSGTEDAIFDTANFEGLSDAVRASTERADRAFDISEGTLQRRQKALGLNLSDRQRASQDRRLSLGRALARATAGKATRGGFQARGEEAARSASGFEDFLTAEFGEGLSGLASLDARKRVAAARRDAEKRASRNALFGRIAGIGLNFIPGVGGGLSSLFG